MKEGYIVWNQTTYGDGSEFFGVYRKYERAERKLKQVIKQRKKIDPEFEENGEDSFTITYFHEKRGDE